MAGIPARLLAALGLAGGAVAAWLWWKSRQAAQLDATDGGTQLDAGGSDWLTGDPSSWFDAPLLQADIWAERVTAVATSRGYRNNNPGNIRYLATNAWLGQVRNDNGYGVYDTPEHGTRALGRQLMVYSKRGIVTVRGIISTWAPANDGNNVAAYVKDVADQLGVGPDDRLDVWARLPNLAIAIAKHENGYIDGAYDFVNWVYL